MPPQLHLDFPHNWRAEILSAPPLIAPARQFTYPQRVPGEEEAISRGALHLLIHPATGGDILATCALGFTAPNLPTGLWSCPHPDDLCAIAGGYAYIVRTTAPETCVFLPLRPVVSVHAVPAANLLIFAGFHTLLAYGINGELWQSARLTWEGLRITEITATEIHGLAWHMPSDAELPFTVSLATGHHTGGAFHSASEKE